MRKPVDFSERGDFGKVICSVEQDDFGRYIDFGWTGIDVRDAKRLRAWLDKAIAWMESK